MNKIRLFFTFSLILASCAFSGCETGSQELTGIYYTVDFVTNGGGDFACVQVLEGNTLSLKSSPTKDDYTFGYWCADQALTNPWVSSTRIYEDMTLYASWYENPTVIFDSNYGSVVDPQTISYNTTAQEPNDPSRTGYTFGGWYSDSVCENQWSFSTKVTSDMVLYAKWYTNPTVYFDSNGGSNVTSQTINYNTAATEPTAPEKTNYNFGGWYTEQTFDNKWEFSTKVTVTMTLYAKWLGTTVEIPSQDQEDAW